MLAPDIKTPLPGPKAKALIERDHRSVTTSYTRDYPFVMARGDGAVVEDVDGNRFIDCAAGIAVSSTGHSHPEVVKAIVEQAQRFLHMSGTDFFYELQIRLAEEMAGIAPIDGPVRSFFGNSGTEAVEAAIKLARYHTKKHGIIAFLGAFHGRTMGSLALTASKPLHRRGFGPMMPGVYHAPFAECYRCPVNLKPESCQAECAGYIEDQIFMHLVSPDEVAAIVFEPIQGEGGYVVPPQQFIDRLKAIAKKHGILLVADEVQCGMGRTGRMFASEHYGLRPDIVTVAKGIASGMPLGITSASSDVMAWPPGSHASTFGGNPVSSAAAIVTIKLLKETLMQNAAEVGGRLLAGLRDMQQRHPIIGDVRGKGLMIGVEFVRDRATRERAVAERDAFVQAMFRRGVLVLGAGKNAVRLAPPLVLSTAQADIVLKLFEASLVEVAAAVDRSAAFL